MLILLMEFPSNRGANRDRWVHCIDILMDTWHHTTIRHLLMDTLCVHCSVPRNWCRFCAGGIYSTRGTGSYLSIIKKAMMFVQWMGFSARHLRIHIITHTAVNFILTIRTVVNSIAYHLRLDAVSLGTFKKAMWTCPFFWNYWSKYFSFQSVISVKSFRSVR